MEPLIHHEGIIIPFNRANIDTDMLLPKQYLKSLEASGFGAFLFDDERYLDPGEIDTPIELRRCAPGFILNQPVYQDGSIILAQGNFGCGSSREHAVWALRDFGIRVVIAPSFGDIFRNNCFNNGLLPLVLEPEEVDELFVLAEAAPGLYARVDLVRLELWVASRCWHFNLEEGRRQRLLNGLNEVTETLTYSTAIREYERKRALLEPWIFRTCDAGF